MSCAAKKIDKVVEFKQKAAFVEGISFKVTRAPFPDFSSGTYEAFGALTLETFDGDAYSVTPANYLFKIDDTAIKSVSPDIADGQVNVPYTSTETDQETDFYVIVISTLSSVARPEVVYHFKRVIGNSN